jgi:hypothetical protein
MDGWVGGWMDGWIDRYVDRHIGRYVDIDMGSLCRHIEGIVV